MTPALTKGRREAPRASVVIAKPFAAVQVAVAISSLLHLPDPELEDGHAEALT